MIIMVVLAIGVPAVYTSTTHYETQNMIQRAENQAEFIGEKAKMMYAYGEGNSDVITVDLEGGIFREIEYLELGNQTFTNLITWEIEGGNRGMYFLDDHISLVSRSREPIRLRSGTHRLRLESCFGDPFESGEDILFVEVSVV